MHTLLLINPTVTPCTLSDHHLISCQRNEQMPKQMPKLVTTRYLQKCDQTYLLRELECAPWHVMEVVDTIDDAAGYWEDLYMYILDEHAPPKKIRRCTKTTPWMGYDISSLMYRRDWLHK